MEFLTLIKKYIRTYSAKNIAIQTLVLSILFGAVHYLCFSTTKTFIDSAVYSAKFLAFLFGGYSLIQTWGRPTELAQRRKELNEANGDSSIICDINNQLANIKKDKETGELFMVWAFFIILALSLMGKA